MLVSYTPTSLTDSWSCQLSIEIWKMAEEKDNRIKTFL